MELTEEAKDAVKVMEKCIADETKAMEMAFSDMVRRVEIDHGSDADTSGLLGHFFMTNLATLNVMISQFMELPCTHYGTNLPGSEEQAEQLKNNIISELFTGPEEEEEKSH